MIEVVRKGISDTIQDAGRFGYQHQGINPNGAMDLVAMRVANALVGNNLEEAVIELCHPASTFKFETASLIAISGADFSPRLNGKKISINQPVCIPVGSELKFSKPLWGTFAYLAIHKGFELNTWLGSKSTNVKAGVGGLDGRTLKKSDVLPLRFSMADAQEVTVFPWRANVSEFYPSLEYIRCIKGNEFDWMNRRSQIDFQKKSFTISPQSDRMGYRLHGPSMKRSHKEELLSTAVTFGTIQLLPNGELIVLMADHQTTGGYPRVAHVISDDRSRLVQHKPNDKINFKFISLAEAEELFCSQQQRIHQLASGCRHKLLEHFNMK
ncbi:MAG: biotin-dependent carboxyltransferase family protein [Cyclobacteriaceae bacterium]|nr:biotin-dependent carboxyltransferase family protein [Cyclobacteriaceae bacterium]